MKKILLVLMAFVLFSGALMAGSASAVDPNDKAANSLLWLVMSDLDMCRKVMKDNILDNVSAIGHVNNAQSALKKAQMDPAYDALFSEINKRLTKIKFYLVMNERRYALDRINQLSTIIRSVISDKQLPGTSGGSYNGATNIGHHNGQNNLPSNGEKPVGTSGSVNNQSGLIIMPSTGAIAVQ